MNTEIYSCHLVQYTDEVIEKDAGSLKTGGSKVAVYGLPLSYFKLAAWPVEAMDPS